MFDVVIGNPPYQNGGKKRFYQLFVLKSMELSDIVAMVTPRGWSSLASNHDYRATLTKSLSCYKALPPNTFSSVQLATSFFVLEKGSTNTTFLYNNAEYTVDHRDLLYIPNGDPRHIKLIAKVLNSNDERIDTKRGELNRANTDPTETGVNCIHSAGRKGEDYDWRVVNKRHMDEGTVVGFGEHKVIFSAMTSIGKLGEVKYAPPNFGCALSCNFITASNKEECERIIFYLESKLFRFLMQQLKTSVCGNSYTLLNHLPLLRNITCTGVLYKQFNLTQEEIDYIESII
jgi:hypothetical protein